MAIVLSILSLLAITQVHSSSLALARLRFNLDAVNVSTTLIPDVNTETLSQIEPSQIVSPLSNPAAHYVASPVSRVASIERAFFFPGNGTSIDVPVPSDFCTQTGGLALAFWIHSLSSGYSIFGCRVGASDDFNVYVNGGILFVYSSAHGVVADSTVR